MALFLPTSDKGRRAMSGVGVLARKEALGMGDTGQKNKGLLMQIAGVIVLLISLRGFFVLQGTVLYFPGILVGVVLFAVCLSKGGALVRKSKAGQS
jgi:hypothetical protein